MASRGSSRERAYRLCRDACCSAAAKSIATVAVICAEIGAAPLAHAPEEFTRYAVHVNRAYLFIQLRQYERAIADLKTAITLKPDQFNAYVNLARVLRSQEKWDDALAQVPELAGAYYLDDVRPLEAAGLVELVDGDSEVAPGVRVQLTGGHTRGHQIVHIESAAPVEVCGS